MNIVAKLKGGVSAIVSFVKSHPIAAFVLVVVVGSFVIVPAVALVNRVKNMIPGANRAPDLKVRGGATAPVAKR